MMTLDSDAEMESSDARRLAHPACHHGNQNSNAAATRITAAVQPGKQDKIPQLLWPD